MPYKYNKPDTVVSPQKNVENVVVLFDSGGFHGGYSVAKLRWNENDVIGVRWNISENEANNIDKINGNKVCLGEPNSRGYSTWFILPDNLLGSLIKGDNLSKELEKYLNESNK